MSEWGVVPDVQVDIGVAADAFDWLHWMTTEHNRLRMSRTHVKDDRARILTGLKRHRKMKQALSRIYAAQVNPSACSPGKLLRMMTKTHRIFGPAQKVVPQDDPRCVDCSADGEGGAVVEEDDFDTASNFTYSTLSEEEDEAAAPNEFNPQPYSTTLISAPPGLLNAQALPQMKHSPDDIFDLNLHVTTAFLPPTPRPEEHRRLTKQSGFERSADTPTNEDGSGSDTASELSSFWDRLSDAHSSAPSASPQEDAAFIHRLTAHQAYQGGQWDSRAAEELHSELWRTYLSFDRAALSKGIVCWMDDLLRHPSLTEEFERMGLEDALKRALNIDARSLSPQMRQRLLVLHRFVRASPHMSAWSAQHPLPPELEEELRKMPLQAKAKFSRGEVAHTLEELKNEIESGRIGGHKEGQSTGDYAWRGAYARALAGGPGLGGEEKWSEGLFELVDPCYAFPGSKDVALSHEMLAYGRELLGEGGKGKSEARGTVPVYGLGVSCVL